MASKRKHALTNGTFDNSIFDLEEAWKRFTAYKKKGFIVERQLRVTEQWHHDVYHTINERGWDSFGKHPEIAVLLVVREFYANGLENNRGKVFVRGKRVSFTGSAINSIYGLSDVSDDDYSRLRAGEVDLDDVWKVIAIPGTIWKVYSDAEGDVYSIKKISLLPVARVWLYFICCRLSPTKHLVGVTKARAILIYARMKGSAIDVGKIVSEAILENMNGTTPNFWFPALITSLCEQAGVHWDESEEKLYIKSPLDNIAIKKIKKGPALKDSEGSSGSHCEFK